MPGPRNSKKAKKAQAKKDKQANTRKITTQLELRVSTESESPTPSLSPSRPPRPLSAASSSSLYTAVLSTLPVSLSAQDTRSLTTPTVDNEASESAEQFQQYLDAWNKDEGDIPELLRKPCVEDLGNGPHVRDLKVFLSSKIAAPPSYEDPLCAEFAQDEVLEMLCTLLPEETAMVRCSAPFWRNGALIISLTGADSVVQLYPVEIANLSRMPEIVPSGRCSA